MNLVDILALVGIGAVVFGLGTQIRALVTAMNLSRESRQRTYKDLRPYQGFAAVFLGWLLLLFALGGAVKAGDPSIIYVLVSLFNFAKLGLLVSGALLAVLFIVYGARMFVR